MHDNVWYFLSAFNMVKCFNIYYEQWCEWRIGYMFPKDFVENPKLHILLDCHLGHSVFWVNFGELSVKCGEFSIVFKKKAKPKTKTKNTNQITLTRMNPFCHTFPILVFEYIYIKFLLLNKRVQKRGKNKLRMRKQVLRVSLEDRW